MFIRLKHKLIYILLSASMLCLSLQTAAVTVLVQTSLGDFELELFDDVAPITVENFISYINDGSYTDSFIHRKSSGFVIQGGAYTYTNDILGEITKKLPIVNEFNLPNTRGTIAMAKFSDYPDSATSSWFINIADNTSLDAQNGGFTVFGQVTGNGMDVVDAIHNLQSHNAGGDFIELPLRDYAGTGTILGQNIIFTTLSLSATLNDFSDLQVTKTVDISNPAPANPVNFTVNVTNAGPDPATNVVISDLMPAGMQLPSAMTPFVSHGSYGLATGIWSLGSLNTGITATLSLPAIPVQFSSPECFVNEAKATDLTQYDPAIANNKAIATVFVGGATECARLTMTVTPSVTTQSACTTTQSDTLNYSVQIRNAGPNTAQNVRVSLSGTLGGTVQSDQIDALTFSEIASDTTVNGTLVWVLGCPRGEQTAEYNLALQSDTSLATDTTLAKSSTYTLGGVAAATATTTASTDSTATDSGGGKCFIATAAYGSYMDPHVTKLREFRDNVLKTTNLGRDFISFYYQYSPPVAAIIADNQFLRFVVRVFLTPVVYAVAYPFVAVLVLVLLVFTMWLIRRNYPGNKLI